MILENGNTVVVTQTGKSPFYSAPETSTGLFLTESDYYSLGITLYELVTGFTPYQNANIENIAQYAQIQQIPYPKDFNKDLADLIDGLTYKDISYRKDKSNPNRRWGYEEVQKWLNGEKQSKPGVGKSYANDNRSNSNTQPYLFKGVKYFSNKELIEAMLSNWEDGQKEVFRGFLSRHYELSDNKKALDLCQKVEKSTEIEGASSDLMYMKLMYELEPGITSIYWKDFKFDNPMDYGNKLIDEVVQKNSANTKLIETSSSFLRDNILKTYLEIHQDKLNSTYKEIVNNCTKLLLSLPLDDKRQALRLGYALTGREDFSIGENKFSTISEFNDFLDKLYNEDIVKFVNYCKNNKKEIELQKEIFTGDKLKEFTSKMLEESKAIVLANGNYFLTSQLIPTQQKFFEKLLVCQREF